MDISINTTVGCDEQLGTTATVDSATAQSETETDRNERAGSTAKSGGERCIDTELTILREGLLGIAILLRNEANLSLENLAAFVDSHILMADRILQHYRATEKGKNPSKVEGRMDSSAHRPSNQPEQLDMAAVPDSGNRYCDAVAYDSGEFRSQLLDRTKRIEFEDISNGKLLSVNAGIDAEAALCAANQLDSWVQTMLNVATESGSMEDGLCHLSLFVLRTAKALRNAAGVLA